MKDLNKLRDRAYKNACEHGFHDEEWSDDHLLCLVICELMEAVQADRKGKTANKKAFENVTEANEKYFPEDEQALKFIITYDIYIKGSVEEELADACIRILDFAGARDLNFEPFPYINIISKSKSFTENIYEIVKDLTGGYRKGLKAQIYFSISHIFYLADIMGIDLKWHIETKMKYNEMRPYKHGCKY